MLHHSLALYQETPAPSPPSPVAHLPASYFKCMLSVQAEHKFCATLLKAYGCLSLTLLVSDALSLGAILGQVRETEEEDGVFFGKIILKGKCKKKCRKTSAVATQREKILRATK